MKATTHRTLLALVVGATITLAIGIPAYATVTSGTTSVLCDSASYQNVDTYWHRTSGPTSFWNDGSSRTVDVRVNNGNKYNYATLSSGQWQGWSTSSSPIGFWYAKAKADTTTSSCSSFSLSYSIVHKSW